LATIRRSLIYSIADSYLSLPLQLLGTMVMSRLLAPTETGVFAVAAVFAAFASTFRDFGVAEYLIQEKDLREDHIRAALTVNIVVSWAMSFLLFVAAPHVASFYRTPGVADVMRIQSVNFILIPFGAVTMAYFRRQLDFRPIFIANQASNIVVFIVSVTCAMNGLSYLSLAWSSLAGVIVTVGVSIYMRPATFPRWPGLQGIRGVVDFGKFASGVYIFGQLGRGAPEMIIGRVQDMASVALFSRGGGIVEIFNKTVIRGVLPVCLPYFSKNNRERGSITSGYLNGISYLTVIGWPIFAFAWVMAYSAVRVIYGAQWIEAVPLTKILCLVGGIELIHYLSKEALMAVQEVRRSNNLQIGIQTARIGGVFFVAPFGLIGASYGLFLAALISFCLSQYHLHRTIGLRITEVLRACSSSALITLASAGPIALLVALIPLSETNYFRMALIGATAFLVFWAIAVRCFQHPIWNEIASIAKKLAHRLRG